MKGKSVRVCVYTQSSGQCICDIYDFFAPHINVLTYLGLLTYSALFAVLCIVHFAAVCVVTSSVKHLSRLVSRAFNDPISYWRRAGGGECLRVATGRVPLGSAMLLVIRGGATTANRHSRATARASLSVPMLTHEHCYYHGPLVLMSASEVTTLWRYTNLFIIVIIIITGQRKYRVGQKTGPQTIILSNLNRFRHATRIFSLEDSLVNLQLNGY